MLRHYLSDRVFLVLKYILSLGLKFKSKLILDPSTYLWIIFVAPLLFYYIYYFQIKLLSLLTSLIVIPANLCKYSNKYTHIPLHAYAPPISYIICTYMYLHSHVQIYVCVYVL